MNKHHPDRYKSYKNSHNNKENKEKIEEVSIILNPSKADWKTWDEIVKNIAQNMKTVETHQLRKVYSEIEKIRDELKKDKKNMELQKKRLLMLKVRLAYAVARKKSLKKLYDYTTKIIDLIIEENNENVFYKKLSYFCDFMEGVLAYHKFYKEVGG